MYAFEYVNPNSAAAASAAVKGDARFLAGGQSLVQALKLRISQTGTLVDLNGIAELKGISSIAGGIVIGAMTRHSEVARSAVVMKAIPALADLAGGIGDQMVRNQGTLGGSIANADPAACYPAALLALGATIRTLQRTLPADKFFTGLFETALAPGELVTSVEFPLPDQAAYVKFKQPASRFALIGVFVARFGSTVRVAVTGAKSSVFRATAIEAALTQSFTAAAAAAVKISPEGINGDMHGSAEYRAAMVSVMAGRAVAKALG